MTAADLGADSFAQTFARLGQPELTLGDLRCPNNTGNHGI
jgi:hypothetical protein